MMKNNQKITKILAILLSALLVAGIVFPLVTAESELLDGQKEMFVKNVTTPPVQDGILNGHQINGETVDEYGTNGPTFCLTSEDLRAVDLEGNPLDTQLPSYVYLYMSKDADALYLAMEIQEAAHSGDLYEFTTFLGFGDKTDADTMNSGIFTTYKMDNGNSARNDPGTWMDTQVTALTAQSVAADGTVTDTTANRKFNVPVEYTLPAWGSESKIGSTPVTVFEAELDFEDALLGSGLKADAALPDYAYFAFELGVFKGTTKIGKIVFNNDMTGKNGAPDGQIKTVPHVINLKDEFNVTSANNANLSTLSVDGGTLSPAFNANTTEYTLTLANGTESAKVQATPVAAETRIAVEGADKIDGITAGGNETITITCTAQNGYVKIYTLNVVWSYNSTDYYVDSTDGSDTTGNGSIDLPFATIEKALAAIAAEEWDISEMATVHINGTFAPTAPNGILFGAKTVFTKGATRLPITIQGDSKTDDIITPPALSACTNNYHFDTMTFNTDKSGRSEGQSAKLYAGSGQIRFDNVNWTTASKVTDNEPATTVFYGDTTTAKVFEGWTATEIAKAKSQNENGNIDTSVTIGENAQYWVIGSSAHYMAAIGDTGGWSDTDGIAVKTTDMEVSVIVDGSRVSRVVIFADASTASTNEYAKANIFLLSEGSEVHWAGIDKNETGVITVNAEVEIGIFDGQSIGTNAAHTSSTSYIRGGRNDVVNGDFTITVESGAWQYVQGGLGEMKVNGNYECNFGGTAYINRDGKDSDGKEYGEGFYGYCGNGSLTDAVTGTITHNIYGGYIKNYYGIHGNSTITKNNVVHNIKGGTIVNYYGAGTSKTTLKSSANLVNNFSGGTISGEIFCAGYKNSSGTAPKVINNISGEVVFASEYRGAYNGNYPIVENNISGGTFNTTYNGVYNSKTKEVYTDVSGGELKSVFYVAYLYTGSADLVDTNISGGIFNSTILGAYGGTVTEMKNTISGGTFVGSGAVHLGGGSSTWPSVVGSIENTITGGDFNVRVYGGGQSCHVTGNIVNNVYGGDLGSFYGGIKASYYSGTTKNMLGATVGGVTAAENSPYYKLGVAGKIINTFGQEGKAGPTFSDPCFGGSLASDREVKSDEVIENSFYSGTWNSTVYGGSDNSNVKITSVTNTVKGGTFTKFFTAGSYNSEITTLTNNVEGGTFKSYFFGGSRRGNITGDVLNNISGGTFESYFFGGSDQNTSSANDTTAPITYTIGGSIKNTISGGTFKSAASGAGFGTVKGNVENTIKGTAKFELGYYGVQATVMETTVEGNVLNLITKDEEGNAPLFAKKNQDIDYVYDNSSFTKVYTTSGSNIGFAAGGGSGVIYMDENKSTDGDVGVSDFTDVKGYMETIVEAGQFDGHYYAAGGVDVFGANEDGYGIINIVRGDPVFGYVWSGGSISSSREAAPKTYNEINSGTFKKQFSAFNRTATGGSKANATEVVTVIKGGEFHSRVEFSEPWTTSHSNQHQRTAPSTLTIEGGTFKGDVYGLGYLNNNTIVGPFLATGGTSTININGGTFEKNIYAAGYPYTPDKFVGEAVINIEPTKGDVTVLGTVEARFDKEIVNLKGGDYKLILGNAASIKADGATGNVMLDQAETWKKQTYVTMPEGNNAVVTVSGPHCFDKVGTSVVAVNGGIKLAGTTLIMTERIAVRALFDKASIDAIDDFSFTFTMGTTTLAQGTKDDLTAWNNDYYSIVLAKIGANDFTETVKFEGSEEVWEYEFSIKSLAIIAQNAWEGNNEGVALAKAIHNFSLIVENSNAELPHELSPDLNKNGLNTFEASATSDSGTNFRVTEKGLVMGNAVGIRIYGNASSAIEGTVTVLVNNIDVTDRASFGYNEETQKYFIDLYVNAKNMSDVLVIEILEGEGENAKSCLKLTDRVDAIAASYPETHEKYNVAQQLLVYIQAAVDYAKTQG